MCTAIFLKTDNGSYFGRNLDYEYGFGEKVVITPRNYKFKLCDGKEIKSHYAMIGMGLEKNAYPLYFDAVNECGLGMAGLNFPDNAVYNKRFSEKTNISSFELILYVLSVCKNTDEAVKLLKNANITDKAFDENLKPSPLHWMIADREKALTLEQTENGLKIYENMVGVLTNNPCFDVQMFNLNNYIGISNKEPKNRFSGKMDLKLYSRGMGGIGLPGDWSSASRFVRACFLKLNSQSGETKQENINSFFHILYSVYHLKGCVEVDGKYEITHYSSCSDMDKGIYYYTVYNDFSVREVDINCENLDGEDLIVKEK